jgi:hypothetical protein
MDQDELREMLVRFSARVREALAEAVRDVRRLTAPLLSTWARIAIERWERLRAFFAAHPDLAETDQFLDRWYSFGTA